MTAAIGLDDVIGRCLIYPQFFQGSLHVNGKLWEFGKRGEDGKSHQSAILRRLAPAANDVHRIGCKIALIGNERLGDDIEPAKKRYYCGFRDANVDSLVLTGDDYKIELKVQPEFGEDAHVDVALFVDPAVPKNKHANLRTAAGLALAEAFGSPVTHTCDCDVGDDNHPFNRLGPECITTGLLGPWQEKSVHLTDISLVSEIVDRGGWPGLFTPPIIGE